MKSLLLRTVFAVGTLFFRSCGRLCRSRHRRHVTFCAQYGSTEIFDPVLNNANADIWILTNLYSTLILPLAGRKETVAGARHKVREAAPDGKVLYAHTASGRHSSPTEATVTTDDVVWSLNRARNPEQWHMEFPAGLGQQCFGTR